jgi:hypothetical protein
MYAKTIAEKLQVDLKRFNQWLLIRHPKKAKYYYKYAEHEAEEIIQEYRKEYPHVKPQYTNTYIPTSRPVVTGNPDSRGDRSSGYPSNIVKLLEERKNDPPPPKSIREKTERTYQGQPFPSYFSHEEALDLCEGMDNPEARKIIFQRSRNALTASEMLQAHQLAEAALKKYGDATIELALSLSKLSSNIDHAERIFTLMDRRKLKTQNPILRFLVGGDDSALEQMEVVFYREGSRRHDDILAFRRKGSQYQYQYYLSRSGTLVVNSPEKKPNPKLLFFLSFLDNPGQAVVNYGLSTGYCSICGRDLKNPKSILLGIGPECRKIGV